MTTAKRIAKFLEQIIARSEDSKLLLFHVNVSGRRTVVWRQDKWHSADEEASIIYEECRNNATGAGQTQRYQLAAFDPSDIEKREALGTISLAVAPDMSGSDDSGSSEPPSNEGLMAMLMRHNSDMHRQSMGTFGILMQYLTGMVEKLQTQNERLVTERMGQAEAMEMLMSRKHDRDMEQKQLEADMKRKDEMFSKIMALAPVALNKLAGKELVRQNDSTLEIVASEFIGTLSGPKLDALVASGMFEKHQLALLVTMLEQVSKRMVTTEEKKKAGEGAQKAVTGGLLDKLIQVGTGGSGVP
jgi:hypothetical protein